jgi:acyl-CoA synthetase (AMP-forming)/AMP-acid ligase II
MSVADTNANIARHLSGMANAQPERCALKIPRGRNARGEIDYLALTFSELDLEVAAWTARFSAAGVNRGDRTLVMVRQGLPLIASVFALFRLGAVPVVIDPGMGLKPFLGCVGRSQPRVLLGIPLAHIISRIFRRTFRSVQVRVSARNSLTARLTRPGSTRPPTATPPPNANATDLAAILFTSGSTGAPKGVCYEHGMFDAQVRLIRDTYEIQPGEIDLPLLPIFALFNPALGMTTIVPELDPRRPAALNPAHIVQAIHQEQVTNSFGSPTLWQKIADHCATQNLTLPSLRRVLCAGAAVPASLWKKSATLLPRGQLHSPYGATEALPVATIAATEIEPSSTRGACVGRPINGVVVKIIRITDAPVVQLESAHELPTGEIGEIIVAGPMVTKRYDGDASATAAAKISAPHAARLAHSAILFHRLGDCGFLDANGRLWFCGRKAERVETAAETLHTEPCEQVFRQHPRAARCALVGLGDRGRQRPALVVETRVKDSTEARALARELRALARQHPHTTPIKLFYFREMFPVDVRHNAKIHRLTLARWATTAKGFESDPKR